MNRKGVALPTSSEETKKNKRECLDQKQILVPELCTIHPFRASLWRQAVALPCVFYRINGLLVADALRARIAVEARIGLPALPPGAPRWDTLSFGWTLADVVRKSDDSEGKESATSTSKPKRNRIKEGTPIAKDEGNPDPGDQKVPTDNLEQLSDRLVNEINEEDKKLKKQSMDIGMWSNDMMASGGRGGGSNRSHSGSRSGGVGGGGDSGDYSDFSDTDSEVDVHAALPDNLTLISNNDNRMLTTTSSSSSKQRRQQQQRQDWVSGIEQKRPFRVGSPTFFSNPNINIPGINDGYDELFEEGLSCSDDDDDFDFDSGGSDGSTSSPRKMKRRSGAMAAGETATTEDGVRIEFRGNQAEAIEDDEEERKRCESLAKEREEERVMVRGFAWNDVQRDGEDSFDKDVASALEELNKVVERLSDTNIIDSDHVQQHTERL